MRRTQGPSSVSYPPATAIVLVLGSGAAGLALQVAWQRTLALSGGVDLVAGLTVVSAFLGGLALGNLLGGHVADRSDPARALAVLGGTLAALAVLAAGSTPILVAAHRALSTHTSSVPGGFAAAGVLLLVPTTLMGMNLPLAARIWVPDHWSAAATIGRLQAWNTAGAAGGTLVATWYLVGAFGLDGATRLVGGGYAVLALLTAHRWLSLRTPGTHAMVRSAMLATLTVGAAGLTAIALSELTKLQLARPALVVAAAIGTIALCRSPLGVAPALGPQPGTRATTPVADDDAPASSWPWYVAVAATGAAAIGFEQVAFRLIGSILRANAYTFGHILFLYLMCLALGGTIGVRVVRRTEEPRRWFLGLQASIATWSAMALWGLVNLLPRSPWGARADRWFSGEGLAGGFAGVTLVDAVVFSVALPLLIIGPAVVCMGASFPLVHAVVQRDVTRIGRRTGGLAAANLAGNVCGGVVTSLVLIDRWGTTGAVRVLAVGLLAATAVVAVATATPGRRAPIPTFATSAAAILAISALVPSNAAFWARLHARDADQLAVAEDRSCASAFAYDAPDRFRLTLDAAGQNGYPFDEFHVLIGLVPALAHPKPERALALGFGIGSTSHALLASGRPRSVTSIELCGGNFRLADQAAQRGIPEFVRLAKDPRHRRLEGDGRRHLLVTDDRYHVVVPDALRPTSASAGNVYSREFFALTRDRMHHSGILASWVPTGRVLASAAAVFPYVVLVSVDEYNGSKFLLASQRPIDLRPDVLERRFRRAAPSYAPGTRHALRGRLGNLQVACVNDGRTSKPATSRGLNHDLFPRDEYFLTNPALPPEAAGCR